MKSRWAIKRFETSYNPLLAERGWPSNEVGTIFRSTLLGTARDRFGEQLASLIGVGMFSVRRLEKRDCVKNRWMPVHLLCTTLSKQVLGLPWMQVMRPILLWLYLTSIKLRSMLVWLLVQEMERRCLRGSTLIHLYLNQGRADAAIEAVSGSLESLASEDPAMRLQKRADVDGAFALVLLASGQEQTAFEKIDKALNHPDRRGVISTSGSPVSRLSHVTESRCQTYVI